METRGLLTKTVKPIPASKIVQDSLFMEVSEVRHVACSGRGRFRVLGVYSCEAGHNLA